MNLDDILYKKLTLSDFEVGKIYQLYDGNNRIQAKRISDAQIEIIICGMSFLYTIDGILWTEESFNTILEGKYIMKVLEDNDTNI